MIFTELSLTNVGLYRGKQTFDLTPQVNPEDNTYRPIILFGGKNGSGKTTLLEMIKLCLYGREILGLRVEKNAYQKYLTELIHRQPGQEITAQQARVTLKFQHSHAGVIDYYEVERNWRLHPSDGGIQESFLVQRNKEFLRDVDIDIWQAFIKDLVPSGVSQLFFFDGEKIQELADDETGSTALAEAIKATFGINLVGYLINDIENFVRKEEEKILSTELVEERDRLEKQISEKQDTVTSLSEKQRELEVSLIDLRKRLAKTREDFEREGGLFAEKRKEAEGKLGEIRGKLAQVEKNLKDEFPQGLMPFATIPRLCLELKEQLLLEEAYLKWQASAVQLEQYVSGLIQNISTPEFLSDTGSTVTRKIISRLQNDLESLKETPAQFTNLRIIHELSEGDRRRLLDLVDRALSEVPGEIQAAFTEYEQLLDELGRLETITRLAPNEDVLLPLVQKQARLLSQEEQLQNEKTRITSELKVVLRDMDTLERKRAHLNEQIRKLQSGAERTILALKAQEVLEEFHTQLLENRIQDLETTLVRYFNQLSRKRNLVWNAKIDRATFSVTLYTRDSQLIPKNSLSAGEKQIYAIALLWALRDISNRPLPVIIDTPLGRLDSDHRQQIVENYFPFASHQVILLSTDTEIDQTYFAALEPAISHCYHLRYDQTERRTLVEEGYFWELAVPESSQEEVSDEAKV
jgi:DNA sulfur modification protein DndD